MADMVEALGVSRMTIHKYVLMRLLPAPVMVSDGKQGVRSRWTPIALDHAARARLGDRSREHRRLPRFGRGVLVGRLGDGREAPPAERGQVAPPPAVGPRDARVWPAVLRRALHGREHVAATGAHAALRAWCRTFAATVSHASGWRPVLVS